MFRRIFVLWNSLRSDARMLFFALRHPDAPGWLKLGAALIVLFAISPMNAIPVIGFVDELVLVPLAVRFLLRRLPPHILEAAAARSTA
jgi:uncharacterized membrane protein YkvA (DUF1232 family)